MLGFPLVRTQAPAHDHRPHKPDERGVMESRVGRTEIGTSKPRAHPGIALVLALLSVPGSTLTWDALPGGGFVFGLPLALAAIALGVQARQRADAGQGKALAAIVIAGAMVAMMVVWSVVESL